MQKIGVLGAGTMGAGIAQAFVMAGKDVVLRDISEALSTRVLLAFKQTSIGLYREINSRQKRRMLPSTG